jgi:Matrixin
MHRQRRRSIARLVIPAMVIGCGISLRAGGVLETLDITGRVESPIPGQIIAKFVGIRWDVRTIPVAYRVNNTQEPIPNPLEEPLLSVADATAVLQQSFDAWNDIRTSYIQMDIVGTTDNPDVAGFDFVNELTFRTAAAFGAIASSPSVSLVEDTLFTAGLDVDGDGDFDVAAGIVTAADVDADGDVEFPEGFYKAGTILDNDVQFNTKTANGVRFTVDDASVDTITRSVDLMAVAVHEFGHSHGLSHDLNNQISATDGTGSTMFPFIDTGDPDAERGQRSLDMDDIAWSSYIYPEGTAISGPAALKRGDRAFSRVFGVVTGEVQHGVLGQPVAGASLFATDTETGDVVSSAFSGTTQVSLNPLTGQSLVIDAAFNILDGKYAMPVPAGRYTVGIEALDGSPVPAGSISLTAQIGQLLGQQNFNEEFYSRKREAAVELERRPATVRVGKGEIQSGIDIVTGRDININRFGPRTAIGIAASPPGRYYVHRIPAETIANVSPGQDILAKSALFDMVVLDSSVVPVFATAILTTGTVNAIDGSVTVDFANPLAVATGFVGQDDDFAPLQFENPARLGHLIRQGIDAGTIENLFLVLQLPTTAPFPGVSGLPPLIGATLPSTFQGSYISDDGVGFTLQPVDFRFSLVLSEPVPPQED